MLRTVLRPILARVQGRSAASRKKFRAEPRSDADIPLPLILANLADVIIYSDPDGRIRYISASVEPLFGDSVATVIGTSLHNYLERIHLDDRETVAAELVAMLQRERESHRAEFRYQHLDGHYVWVEAISRRTYEPDGLVLVIRDISARKAAEEALEASEARYRSVITAMAEGVILLSRDGTIQSANHAAARILGIPEERIIGASVNTPDWKTLDEAGNVKPREQYPIFIALTTGIPQMNQVVGFIQPITKRMIWLSVNVQPLVQPGETMAYAVVASFSDITERREGEQALKRSEAQYATLVNSIEGIVWEADTPSFSTEFVSPQIETILGYSPDEATSDPDFWKRIVDPDDYARMSQVYRTFLERGWYEEEYRMRAADGRTVWMRDSARVITNAKGEPRFVGILLDISESKRAQEAEQRQWRLAEALRDTAATLTSTLDQDEVFDRILDQVVNVVPHETADIILIEDDIARVVRTKTRNRPVDERIMDIRFSLSGTPSIWTMVATGRPLVLPDVYQFPGWVDFPETRWIRSHIAVPMQLEGEVIGFLALNSASPGQFDETHAAQLEIFAHQAAIAIRNARLFGEMEARVAERTRELEVERWRLAFILNATGEGIYYAEGYEIQFVNEALCRLTGFEPEEMIGQPVNLFRPANATAKEAETPGAIMASIASGVVWRGETRMRRKDGSEFIAGLTVSRVGGANSPALGSVTIVRDISAERELEIQKIRFVANASHELRTPLTNLITRLYLLRRMPERLNDHLEILEDVSTRMRRLVEDLLDVSRFQRGVITLRPQEVILQELVQRVVRTSEADAQIKHITLETNLPDTPLRLTADPERLIQVMTNLVINAIHYTAAGGRVRLSVAQEADTLSNHPPCALFEVEDTGLGIGPEHMPHIFEPFYRVMGDAEGTGLGLSISKDIIDLHGGRIDVESQLGVGSRFTVRLPMTNTVPEAVATSHSTT